MRRKNYIKLGVAVVVLIIALAVIFMNVGTDATEVDEEGFGAVGGMFVSKIRDVGINDNKLTDNDNDGVRAVKDCDDNDPNIGATQTYYADNDGDGFGSGSPTEFCDGELTFGYADNDFDCDDANSAINPAAIEYCNGYDDDCNEGIDEVDCSSVDLVIGDGEFDLELTTSTTSDGMAVYMGTLSIEITNPAMFDDASIGVYYMTFPDYSTLLEISGDNTEILSPGETYILEESFAVYENVGEYDSIVFDGYLNVNVVVDYLDELTEANEMNNEVVVQATLI